MKHDRSLTSDRVLSLARYFRKQRATYVERYRAAKYLYQRHEARQWVLHYGRLIRKLEATQ